MKCAVIGLGVIGTVHIKVLRSLGINLTAVCDIDESRLAAYPDVERYTDYRVMLDREKPDVVHVCTPHYLHTEMIVEALERDINVLCEKPLCIRREDLPRIAEAERASRAQLGVCLQNRYCAVNRYVKEFLEGKEVTDATGSVVWHRDAAYYASGAWRGKKSTEGGGVLINQAIHTLDLLEWFSGEPTFVTAAVSNLTLQGEIEVEDTVSALYSGAAQFSLFATNGAERGFPVEMTLTTKEHYLKVLPDHVVLDGDCISFTKDSRLFGKYSYGTGHEMLIGDFYDCVRSGKKFAIDGTEGAKSVKLVLAAYESGGRKIRI